MANIPYLIHLFEHVQPLQWLVTFVFYSTKNMLFPFLLSANLNPIPFS